MQRGRRGASFEERPDVVCTASARMTIDTTQPDWFIAGGGAIGLALASRLHLDGQSVGLLGRDGENGSLEVRYSDVDGIHHDLEIPFTRPDAGGSVGRLLIATKAFSVREVLRTWGSSLDPAARLFLLQNGIGFHDPGELPGGIRHLFTVNAGFTAYRDEHGTVVQTACSEVMVGESGVSVPVPDGTIERDLAALESAGLRLRWTTDIDDRRWIKLAVNAVINPLSVIHGCRNGEIPERDGADAAIRGMCGESARVLERMGIDFSAEDIRREVLRVAGHTARNYSSMHQDHRRGDGLNELRYINLPLIEAGDRHGLDMSTHRSVYERTSSIFADLSSR